MAIPFCDLARANEPLRDEIDAAIRGVIDRGWYLRGPETAAFEEEWASYCGQRYGVSCNSGTDALTLAATAMGLEQVEVQANTLPLSAIGLHRAGTSVEIRDVDPDGRLAEITPRAVPVLLYGRRPSANEARAVLFDAAHAHGWKPPGHAAACWSFYPTKSLGALGDAGAITTNDQGLAQTMRDLSGRDDAFYSGRQITSRMDEIQAAVLRVKLRRLDSWIEERRWIWDRYAAGLPTAVTLVSRSRDDFHHLLVVMVPARDALADHLGRAGIGVKIHFPAPLNLYPASWASTARACPEAERWCKAILTLPCYPGLTEREVDRICERIADFYERSETDRNGERQRIR